MKKVEPLINSKNNPDKFPYTYNTMRRMHCLKEHPELIFKIHGRLFFNWNAWDNMVEEAQEKSINR